ncbi:hypothetical protein V1264_003048 [Littorina saxatilis]|uniref:Chitin-binding type-2 domain-containing protein n=1 Tax=Littorina saxatilis TaxID=31220 RepID=A0AAN9B527_9CAEN
METELTEFPSSNERNQPTSESDDHCTVANHSPASSRASDDGFSQDNGSDGNTAEAGRSPSRRTANCACSQKKTFWAVCLPVSAIIVGAGLVGLYIAVWSSPDIDTNFFTDAILFMKADDVFNNNMATSSSGIFFQYQKKFCTNVEKSIKDEISTERCWIRSLRRGSIRIESRLLILTKKNYTSNDLKLLFTKGGTQRGHHTLLGSLVIYTDSIRVDIVETREISSKEVNKLPREFDCARNDEHYLPLLYTFPRHCGEYQLCKDGKGISHVCDKGLEYGYTKGGLESPCRKPSNRTHCGQLRLKEALTTSPTPLTSSTEKASGTTMRTTTLVSIDCSIIDERILDNSSTLYECPQTGNDTFFVPRHDTFPHNCLAYNTCKGGTVLDPGNTHCPKGSPFTLKKEPCDHEYSNQTFCVQMERAQWCRENS